MNNAKHSEFERMLHPEKVIRVVKTIYHCGCETTIHPAPELCEIHDSGIKAVIINPGGK